MATSSGDIFLTRRHNDLTSQHKLLKSQHKDPTSRHNYLTSDGRNMPPSINFDKNAYRHVCLKQCNFQIFKLIHLKFTLHLLFKQHVN